MDGSGGKRQQRNGGIEIESGVTPSSSVKDPSYFAPQSSSFGGVGAGGNGFGVGVGAGVRGGSEGGGL